MVQFNGTDVVGLGRVVYLSEGDVLRMIPGQMGSLVLLYKNQVIVGIVYYERLLHELLHEAQHEQCEPSRTFTVVMETSGAVSNRW